MKQVKTISLASFTLTINNSQRGDQISIGGGGKLIGTCTYEYQQNIFTMVATADGGVAASHNAAKFANVSITFTQTSPDIDTLVNFILWCSANPDLAGYTNITARDATGIFAFNAVGCLPAMIPGNTMGDTPQQRTFTFHCAELTPNEGVGGTN